MRDHRRRRFFWIDNDVLDKFGATLGPIGLAVYCCLARHADANDREAHPSFKTIALEIGASRRAVIAAVKKMRSLGLVQVTSRSESGRRTSNLYSLEDPPTAEEIREAAAALEGGGGAPNAPPACSDSAPPAPDPVHVVHHPSAPHAPDPYQGTRHPEQDTPGGPFSPPPKQETPEEGRRSLAFHLAMLWCDLCTRRDPRGAPRDTVRQVQPDFEELLRLGAEAGEVERSLRDPKRDRGEHLWQFRRRWREMPLFTSREETRAERAARHARERSTAWANAMTREELQEILRRRGHLPPG